MLAAFILVEKSEPEDRPKALRALAFAETRAFMGRDWSQRSRQRWLHRQLDALRTESALTERARERLAAILKVDPLAPKPATKPHTTIDELLARGKKPEPKPQPKPVIHTADRVRSSSARSRERRAGRSRPARAAPADDDGPEPAQQVALPVSAIRLLAHAAGIPAWREGDGVALLWCPSCSCPGAAFDRVGATCENGCSEGEIVDALANAWRR